MSKKKETLRRGIGVLLAVILTGGMLSPLVANAGNSDLLTEVSDTEESAMTTDDGLGDTSEDVSVTEKESTASEEIVTGEESAAEAVILKNGAGPSSGAIPVNFGSSFPLTLNYTNNQDGGTLIIFECPEDGFYTAFADDNPTSIGVDYSSGYGIYYQVYNADEDGHIDYTSKLYDNYGRLGFQNPWYSDANGNPVYMEGGKTYYLYLRNRSWDGQPHDVTVELRHRETQFTITNNSAEGSGAKEVVLNFETLSSSGSAYGYAEGSFEDLIQLTNEERNRQPKNAIKMSLSPGESKVISMIPSYNSLPWSLTAKYSQDYDTDISGDRAGVWNRNAELHTYNISFTCTPAEDSGAMTTFHSVSDLSELNEGDHYIFAAKQGDSYYALACDFVDFVTPVELKAAELTNANGGTYAGYTLDVSQRDLTKGDYVLECMQPGDVADTYTSASNAKFRSNILDPETGKRLALKMGRWNGDSAIHMFSDTSGNLYIGRNDGDEGYCLWHSGYAALKLIVPENGEPKFIWNKYGGDGNNDIIILTDSKKSNKKEELEGEQLFTRISAYDLSHTPQGAANKILLAFEGNDGTHYALTTKGPVPIEDPSSEVFPTLNYDDPAPTIHADVSYAYIPGEVRTGYYDKDYYYIVRGLEQNGNYFYDLGYMYPDREEPYATDSPVDLNLLVEKDAILSFDPWTYNPDREIYAYNPVVKIINEYMGWDERTKNLCEVDDLKDAVRFELYRLVPGFAQEKYHEMDDLSAIENWEKLLITVEGADGKQKALVYNEGDLGLVDVLGGPDEVYNPCYFSSDDTITAVSRCALTPGDVISISKTNFKIKALTWKDVNRSLYIDGYAKKDESGDPGQMTDSREKECMFSYAADGHTIVLRGAKNWLHYDPETETLSAAANKEDATPIRIWAIDRDAKDPIEVIYHTPDKNVLRKLKTENDIDLMELPETTNNGDEYIFVGWSTDKNSCGFLSLDDSCNLYDYNDDTRTGYIKRSAAEKFSILGNCTPEVIDAIDPCEYAVDGKLELYPVYARKSLDSVVTADDGKTPIIGISDWKDLQGQRPQGGHDEDEQWLGKIYCNVYLDGEKWVDSEPLYFCYHNDDAADINLKFISDELLGNYQDSDDPLYAYMSDETVYPETAQKGDYVIDAVYADQGGSEDGLKYKYNWMTNHGGRLDNVRGGSTISVYVTSLYQVEYFLDDVELTGDAWQNVNVYATPGTDNAVKEKAESSDYLVKTDNELHALMDRSISDDSAFVDENIIRGDYSSFVYYIRDYQHTIPIAAFPAIPQGKEFTSAAWKMKVPGADAAQTLEVAEEVAPGSDYDVKGTGYGTGNTVHAWMDGVDDSRYTYHLYIYTKEKEPEPTPEPGKDGTDSGTDDSSGSPEENAGEAAGTSQTVSPKTGDSSQMELWIALMLAACGGIGTICFGRKKKVREK